MTTVIDGVDGPKGLRAHVGRELGVSDWFTIDQERIDAFGALTFDEQWIHCDPEQAAAGPFGAPIAHGLLLLSLIPLFGPQIYRIDGIGMVVNCGSDRVRFLTPVPAGSRIRAGAELLAVVDVEGGAQATVRFTMELDGAARPAYVADLLLRVYP